MARLGAFRAAMGAVGSLALVLVPASVPVISAAAHAAADPCFESHDPECGPVVWTPPPPPNDPATITYSIRPEHPHVGDTVHVHLVVDDPDSGRIEFAMKDWGDGTPAEGVHCDPFQFGTWPTPPEEAVHAEYDESHVYQAAGDYHATFSFDLGCGTPYREFDSVDVPITVTPVPLLTVELCLRRAGCNTVDVPRP